MNYGVVKYSVAIVGGIVGAILTYQLMATFLGTKLLILAWLFLGLPIGFILGSIGAGLLHAVALGWIILSFAIFAWWKNR